MHQFIMVVLITIHLQSMLGCQIIFLIFACIFSISAIKVDNKQIHRLNANQTISIPASITQIMRYTFVQYEGRMQLKVQTSDGKDVANHQSPFIEALIPPKYIGANLVFILTAKANISVAEFTISNIQKYQMLPFHHEKFIHIKKGESRVIQIIPKSKGKLLVQRFDGVPAFINNICSSNEKKQCLDQMHRFTAGQMKKHIDVVELQACSNCILIVKITTNSAEARIRMSIEANRTNLQSYPSLVILKKDEVCYVKIYSQMSGNGKVIKYSGEIEISSSTSVFEPYSNSYSYSIKKQPQGDLFHVIFVKGVSQNSFSMIESPSPETSIALIDGLPSTYFIQQNKIYHVSYQKHNEGKTKIVLSSQSSFMERLSIKFVNPSSHSNYLIRPKYMFGSQTASQSFELPQRSSEIIIQVHLVSGEGGYLNISSRVNQYINLPLDFAYVSKLSYKQHDDYVIEGVYGTVDVFISKCVDCSLTYQISDKMITKNPNNTLNNISMVEQVKINGKNLFIRISTNNFAYYSITLKQHHPSSSRQPLLHKQEISFYLQQEDNLLIEFNTPICNNRPCPDTKFYLLQGSDYQHVASKIYCPFSLFNFDQRTKDIQLQEIKPAIQNQIMSYARPLKHRDYIGIIAQVGERLLPYKVINTQEIKLYKSMKWPIFYLSLFITAACLCSFIAFMVLRKKARSEQAGYVRVSKIESAQNIS